MLSSSFQSDPLAWPYQIVARYELLESSATIVPFAETEGFSGAAIFRVVCAAKTYCLRRWPMPGPEIPRLKGLHRLLAWTCDHGLDQVAVPLKLPSGASWTEGAGYLWQLEPWKPGRADFHLNPNRNRLREALRILARWQIAARTFVPQASEVAWFASTPAGHSPGLQERWHAIRDYQQSGAQRFLPSLATYPDLEIKAILQQIWQKFQLIALAIAAELGTLLPCKFPLQPCLRDIWHDHILFTGDEVTGVIDASACRTENVTTDIARLLGSLVGDDRSEWDFALTCYQELRPLTLLELRLLNTFDLSGVALSGATWLDWLLIQHKPIKCRQQLLDRLTAILRRMHTCTFRIVN